MSHGKSSHASAFAFGILIALLCLLALVDGLHTAQAGSTLPPPTVSSVAPNMGPEDLDTPIVIEGAGFAGGISGSEVITPPTVRIGGVKLAQVGWVSSTRLTATVPFGLTPGLYDVTVTNEDGQSGSLPQSFGVTQAFGRWNTGGPYGGNVMGIVVNPNNPTTLYVNAQVAIFRSYDGGDYWSPVLTGTNFDSLVIDPAAPDTIYASDMVDTRVVRSDDGGNSWTYLPLPGSYERWYDTRLAVQSTITDSVVWVGLREHGAAAVPQGGLFRSANRGATWIDWTHNLTDTQVSALAFDPISTQIIYAGTSSGNVFKSANGGLSWVWIGKPDTYISQLVVNPSQTDELWAAGGGYGFPGRFFGKYSGGSWQAVYPAGPDGSNPVAAIAFDPANPEVMWIGDAGHGTFRSADGGTTWTRLAPAFDKGHWGWSVGLHPTNGTTVYAGYGALGVWRSQDSGATWQQLNTGLAALVPTQVEALPTNPTTVYAAIDDAGIFRSDNGGGNWQMLNAGDFPNGGPKTLALDSGNPPRLYTAFYSEGASTSGVRYSDDGGTTWQDVHLPSVTVPSCPACQANPEALAATSGSPARLVLGARFMIPGDLTLHGGGIYTSNDRGESWSYADLGEAIPGVASVSADPSDPLTFYAGTLCVNEDAHGTKVWYTHDGGATWHSGGQGLEWPCGIMNLAVDPQSRDVYANYGGSIYVSADGGASWQDVLPRADLFGGSVQAMHFTADRPSVFYLATTAGLCRQAGRNQDWQWADGALGMLSVRAVDIVQTSDRSIVYAATLGGTTAIPPTVAGRAGARSTTSALLSAGVYRNTSLRSISRVYLPVLTR